MWHHCTYEYGVYLYMEPIFSFLEIDLGINIVEFLPRLIVHFLVQTVQRVMKSSHSSLDAFIHCLVLNFNPQSRTDFLINTLIDVTDLQSLKVSQFVNTPKIMTITEKI